MIKGSCLCGKVQYVIDGQFGPVSHCHCVSCRKAQGAPFATVARIKIDSFRIEEGEEILSSYNSSPKKKRYFCSNCGAQLHSHMEGQDEYVIRLGTLDDDPGVKPVRHIFVSEKAPWYEIKDDLEQFQTWPK